MALLQKTSIGTFIFKSVDIYKMGCSQKHVQVIKNKKHKNYILHTKIKPINKYIHTGPSGSDMHFKLSEYAQQENGLLRSNVLYWRACTACESCVCVCVCVCGWFGNSKNFTREMRTKTGCS